MTHVLALFASSSLTSTPTLSPSTSSSSLSTILILGTSLVQIRLSEPLSDLTIPRWHDHDADEIQQHADLCIAEAIKNLESAGWAQESVKVIGTFPLSSLNISLM